MVRKVKVADESPKYKLNRSDGKKILTGAYIAVGGALLTYASELLPMIDWGAYTAFAVAGGSILINAGRKWLAGR